MSAVSEYIPAMENTRASECQCSPWWMASSAPLPVAEAIPTPETEQKSPESCCSLPKFPDESDADNEFFWQQIPDADHAYLTSHHSFPAPCPWCGGRTRHNPTCHDLQASWTIMPFGKFKGKPLSEVPNDYLDWLLVHVDSFDPEIRRSIENYLRSLCSSGVVSII